MRTKTFSAKRLLSLVLTIAMFATMILPTSVFAAITAPTAVATVIENADGTQTKTITISFVEAVVLDSSAALDTDISVAGKTFGTSTMVLDPATQKDLVITLADDADVVVGEMITFANDKIINATDNTDFFNDDIEITGSLACATIDYSGIVPDDATIEVTGYASAPTSVGIGTFNYTLTKDNYVTKTGSFVIGQDNLGTTVTVSDTMEKNGADYTALDAAISSASAYAADNYTATSFAALTTAVNNANAVDRSLKFDEQSTIDDLKVAIENAINGLVSKRTVDFMAVGVTDDVNANYGKATKVVIVFDEPIDATAFAVLDNLSIKDKVSSATWADTENTVLSLTLNADANLSNSTSITYTANDAVKTKLLPAVVDTKTVVAFGNFVGAAELVTATDMAATIVKISAKPGVVEGDKVVIVFNAPVEKNPATITVNGMTATAVAGTNNTVYEIKLVGNENITDSTVLTYGTMTTALNGSFGKADIPVAMKATAVDNDGTELVYSEKEDIIYRDQIVIKFNVPTNGANDISKVIVKGNKYTATLGASTMQWDSTKTVLTITLESDAVIKDGVEIDLRNVGIKDFYDTESADESSLVMKVGGSFGYSIQPRITKAIAFSQNELDYIRVFFNTEVEAKGIIDPTLSGFTVEPSVIQNAGLVNAGNGLTYYEIVMGKDDHSAFTPGSCKISLVGIVDTETKTKALSDTAVDIKGAFVTPIQPAVLKLVAISNDGSGIAKEDDKIIAIFNTEVSEGNITLLNGASFGDGYETKLEENVMEITLGKNPTVAVGSQIRFSDFKDKATLSSTMASKDIAIGGSFGEIIAPKILSATAISNDGSGIAKENDLIVLVFNTAVTGVTSELGAVSTENNIVWTIKLGANPEVVPGETVLTFDTVKSVAANAPIQDADKSIKLGGSFGYKAEANVKSVVLSEKNGKETITVIFDRKTTKPALFEQDALKNNNAHLDVKATSWNEDGTVLTLELGEAATTTATVVDDLGNILSGTLDSNDEVIPGDVLNLSGLGIKALDTNEEIAKLDKLAITGSLVPVVQTAVVNGNVVTITFSARTNGAGVDAIKNQKALYGSGVDAEWTDNNKKLVIEMSDDNTMSNNAYIVLNGLGIKDGFSGKYTLVGQYKIDTTDLKKKTLNITSVFVKANATESAPREDVTKGLKGDNIIVRFEDVTNKTAGTDAKANIELVTVTDSFGEGYTATWSDNKTIIVTLGENPAVTTESQVIIKDVKFANRTGYLAENGAEQVTKSLTGQFDGRTYWIVNSDKVTANGRVRVVGTINKADITNPAVFTPFVVCQAMNSENVVLSINAIKLSDIDTSDVVFDFDATNLAKIKMFVLNGDYSDPAAIVSVFSETIEK